MGSNCCGRGEHVDEGEAALKLGRAQSDHAAHDNDLEFGALLLDQAHAAELGVGAILSVLAHAAGVDDHDVGCLRPGGGLHAEAREASGQLLAVRNVHLAADGPEEVALDHRCSRVAGGGGGGIRTLDRRFHR